MKRNKILNTSVLVAFLALLVSCGPTVPETSDTGSSSVPQEDIKNVRIDFWHTFNKDTKAELERRIQEFEDIILENEGVHVEVVSDNYGDYTGVYENVLNGYGIGQVPNIAVAYPDHVAAFLQQEAKDGDLVVNLAKLVDDPTFGFGTNEYLGDSKGGVKFGNNDFVPAFMEEASSFLKPGQYILPFMKSSEILFYNEGLLLRALKAYDSSLYNSPADAKDFIENCTWEELIDLCSFIKDHDKPGVKDLDMDLKWPLYYDSDGNLFITKMFQKEIPFSSVKDGRGYLDFAEPANKEKTVQLVAELKDGFDKGLFSTRGIEDEFGSTYFTKGEVLFTIGSSGGATFSFPQGDAFTTGICRAPASGDNQLYVTQGPCLTLLNRKVDSNNRPLSAAMKAKETEYSFKLIKYLTNPQLNAEMCMYGSRGYVPVRTSAYATDTYVDFLNSGVGVAGVSEIVQSMADQYFYTAAFKGSAELRECCKGLLTSAFTGTDPAVAVDEMIAKAKAAL